MHFQVTLMWKWFLAVTALEQFFFFVSLFMPFQETLVFERFLTVSACEGFFAQVSSFMYFQEILIGKCSVTETALKWLFMNSFMTLQVTLLWKCYVTETALKWLSPVWIRSWLCNRLLRENDFTQRLHWNGLSPVWIRSCTFKLPLSENDLSQCVHEKGFSTLCLLLLFAVECPTPILFSKPSVGMSFVISTSWDSVLDGERMWTPLAPMLLNSSTPTSCEKIFK